MSLYTRPKKDQERRSSRVNTSILLPPSERQENNKRVSFCSPRGKEATRKTVNQLGQELLSSCLTTSTPDLRVSGGANNPAERNVGKLPRTDSECQFNAPGLAFLKERDTSVKTQEVKMSPSIVMKKELKHKCDFFPKYLDPRPFKDQNTQTLYRESSAQTLPYLPEVSDQKIANTLELFRLPSALPGDQPPGLHEVELLDRARKRWSFKDALKANFRRLNHSDRKLAITSEYKTILEAFEWEQWIQREEYIQECQMMRLEIVIKMFDKREREMHAASKTRIETACQRIEKRRQAGLRKNEIDFQRGMRRLEIQVANTPRRWVKESPLCSLGSHCSEFYAPPMRHGVDPARRSFESKLGRKAFDMRIDDLEKRINMNNLKCPFRKLKDWSKPKQHVREYEQNFCSDANLQKLFESLKALSKTAAKEKEKPKCLRKRRLPLTERAASQLILATLADLYETEYDRRRAEEVQELKKGPVSYETTILPSWLIQRMKDDRKVQDMENMLNIYEGSYIGWVMQFLSEEMHRLTEQRKLHFFSVLAQKERWRREAAEAGLRQKENEMRLMYEEMFQQCNVVNNQISEEYIRSIFTKDMHNVAEGEATESVKHLARQIDKDIERWLESFKLIQNPLTFEPLRHMLCDMVSPDLNAALESHESFLITQYIIEDVIFPEMWTVLDPIDVGTTLTSDLIARLIDDDLYLFSSESESDSPQKTSWKEAKAIIRKLIRQAVPGQRWKDEAERIVAENYNDLFDELFADIFNPPPISPSDLINLRRTISQTGIRMSDDIRARENFDYEAIEDRPSGRGSKFMRMQLLSLIKKLKTDHVTRDLVNLDEYSDGEDDQHLYEDDAFLGSTRYNPLKKKKPQEDEDVFSMRSTLNVNDEINLSLLKGRGYRVMLPSGEERNSIGEEPTCNIEDALDSDFIRSLMSPNVNEIEEAEDNAPTPAKETPILKTSRHQAIEKKLAKKDNVPTPGSTYSPILKPSGHQLAEEELANNLPTIGSTHSILKPSRHQSTEEESQVEPIEHSELNVIEFEPSTEFLSEISATVLAENDSPEPEVYKRLGSSVLKSFSSSAKATEKRNSEAFTPLRKSLYDDTDRVFGLPSTSKDTLRSNTGSHRE